jgi:flavin-dependent dehydrogenase
MAQPVDVAVIGGGPAGASVALCLARRGRSVALIEAPGPCHRDGETLPPEINPVLRELKVLDAFYETAALESPGIVSSWGGPEPYEQDFLRNPHGPGWHVDRSRFDAMLCREAARAGARRIRAAGPIARDGDLWRLGHVTAHILVDASGRNGIPLGRPCRRRIDDRLLALILRAAAPSPGRTYDLRAFIEAVPAGWWYSAPAPDAGIVAMLFTDCAVYTREGIVPEEQLRHAPLTGSRLEGAAFAESRVVYVTSSIREEIAGDAWLSVGDSASSYDPLSGRGIFKALRHASRAAEAIVAYLSGDLTALERYASRVRAEFEGYATGRRLYYASETRWPETTFWRRRS